MTTDSLRFKARLTGAVYLFYFLTAVAAGLCVKGIVVSGDASATATNILAHESLLRLGSAVGLISTSLYIVMTALFYDLFRPVSKTVSLLAAFCGLVGCAVQAVGSLFQLAPLFVLGGDSYLSAFTLGQLQALTLLLLKLHTQASSVEIIFFVFYDLLIGYLLFRSLFLPQVLGALMGLAGLGWLTFLAPPIAGHLTPYIQIIGFLAEVALMLWLLIKGLDATQWMQQAKAACALET